MVAVGGVQGVDVGALQPVAEQGQEVGREKYPLQSETLATFAFDVCTIMGTEIGVAWCDFDFGVLMSLINEPEEICSSHLLVTEPSLAGQKSGDGCEEGTDYQSDHHRVLLHYNNIIALYHNYNVITSCSDLLCSTLSLLFSPGCRMN